MARTLHRLGLAGATVTVILASTAAIAREKTDVIVLVNGDRLTGEIIELEYGELTVKTDSLGTVGIEWLDVAQIESTHTFSVESNVGGRYSGAISPGAGNNRIRVASASGTVELPVGEVSRIGQLETGFIEQLNGSVSLGFSETRSSDVSTLRFDFDTEHRTDLHIASLAADFTSDDTADQGSFNQYSVTFLNHFLRPGDKFWLALASFDSNEQQGIDGRLLLGAARGKYLIRRQESELATYVGVGLAQEWAPDSDDDQQSAEGLLGLQWKIFRFKHPETSLTSRLLILPGLTETGRYRARTKISLRHEIVKDFYVDLSLNGNYDSDPPTAGADSLDYTVSTSLGYKF